MVKFSIILPVYNAADFLPRTFGSILSQSIDQVQYEVIVVDDGSTDSSLEIIQDFEQRFLNFKWTSQENGGVSVARNRALDLVSGEYVLFLDADDTFRENALSQVADIVNHEDADIFFFDNKFSVRPMQYTPDEFLSGVYFSVYVWKTCIRYRLIQDNIRFSEGYILEDGIFLLEAILRASKIVTIGVDLVSYNYNAKSLVRDYSDNKKNRNMIDSFIYIINKYQEIADKARNMLSNQSYVNLIERRESFIFSMFIRMMRYGLSNQEITKNFVKVGFTSFTVFPGVHHPKKSYKFLARIIENRFLRNMINATYKRLK